MSKPVIMCVDDEKIVLDSLKQQLRRSLGGDYSIEVAESGEEARENAHELAEDKLELVLTISDQLMPKMKGDTLLIELHKIFPDTHKILLTGQANAEAVGNAVNHAKLYRYIGKPWDKSDLLLTVNEAISSYRQKQELADKSKKLLATNSVLEKFLPRDFLRCMGKTEVTDLQLGEGIEQVLTVLFADMRGFLSLSETMSPQENFAFLNRFLSCLSPVIRKNNGFIVTFMGDAILALFPECADDAVRASLEMQHAMELFNSERVKDDSKPVKIGMGIDTGRVMLGLVGGERRWEGAVVSNTVNTAGRIENLSKVLGISIGVSEATVENLKNKGDFECLFLGDVMVHGRHAPVSVFEVLDVAAGVVNENRKVIGDNIRKGLGLYRERDFEGALVFFEANLALDAEDRASQVLKENCRMFIKSPPGDNFYKRTLHNLFG